MPELNVISELNFSVSEAIDILKPLAVLLAEILLYALFVFAFYRFMARRDIIAANLSRYNKAGHRFARAVFYFIQHVVIFPILIICWTTGIVMVLSLMGQDKSPESILLVSVALVCTIRVAAYFTEDLSRDLAKMLPFAILGLYLVNKSYVSLSVSSGVIKELPDHWEVIVYYIVFAVVLELALRIVHGIISIIMAPVR